MLSYGCTVGLVILLDVLWLSVMMPVLYKPRMAHLLADHMVYAAAPVFYLLYAFGLYWFVISPSQGESNWLAIFATGALFGLVAYGTYDLTNQVTLRGWPVIITIIDLVWGGAMAGIVCVLAVFLTTKIFTVFN